MELHFKLHHSYMKHLFALSALCVFCLNGFSQNIFKGHIHEHSSKEQVVFATITIDSKETVQSDLDGQFAIRNLEPGTHTIQIKQIGYQTLIDTFEISNHQEQLHFFMLLDGESHSTYVSHKTNKDYAQASGGTVTREDLAKLPTRSAKSIASSIAGTQHIEPVRGCCAPIRISSCSSSSSCSVAVRGCCARTIRNYDDSNVYHNQTRQLHQGYGKRIKGNNLQEMRALRLN